MRLFQLLAVPVRRKLSLYMLILLMEFVLAHNGNLTNKVSLKKELWETDRRHINTSSDSEILLNIFAHELQQCQSDGLTEAVVFQAIEKVYQRCKGAYAAVALIANYGMVCFRDAYGIRPAVFW